MNNPYSEFANVYDVMQYDVDYDFWHDQILKRIATYRPDAKRILELACGTGTMAISLSKAGFITEGIDLSEDMLAIAANKAGLEKQKIKFYNQNMIDFETHKHYDIILCLCDGMNYLNDEEQFQSTLSQVKKHLLPGGLFIFDLSSIYKLSQIIGNSTFAETFEHSAYIWENEYDEISNQLNFLLTLFIDDGSTYKRLEEYHQQRAYRVEEVETMIMDDFDVLELVDGDSFEALEKFSQRICFVLKLKE
ncbi:MAG: class I SAM-dependent methyltransferase [Clostridia bacterium]|nr:class I SAM-dependent methyltransferase [Clostridia bacterium]